MNKNFICPFSLLNIGYIFLIYGLLISCAIAKEQAYPIESLPDHLIYTYTEEFSNEIKSSAQEQLYANHRRWEQNRILRVCFFGGNQSVTTLVKNVAVEWNKYSGVKLDFGPSESWYNCLAPQQGFFQIRIGFNGKGNWSVIGRDSENLLDPAEPSMNLEKFNRKYTESKTLPKLVVEKAEPYDRATILHEFGHALGLLHEHQNPKLNCQEDIKWEGPKNVYDYFSLHYDWDRIQVDRNLKFIKQTDPDYIAGDADLRSIMIYALPKEIYKNGAASKCYVDVNYVLSEKDKQIISKLYPLISEAKIQQDISLEAPYLRPMPAFLSQENRSNFLYRIISDLDSNDTYTRRNARKRLFEILQSHNITENDISALIDRMDSSSYRYQLGVAVALAKTNRSVNLNDGNKRKLLELQRKSRDTILIDYLKEASK